MSYQSSLPKLKDTYRLLETKLGSGTYGHVYEGYSMVSERKVAIKIFRKKEKYSELMAKREISALRSLKHEHIVSLIEAVCDDHDNICMVMELCCTTLSAMIEGKHIEYWPAAQLKGCALQILKAIDFCHEKKMLHRDLKPENILITDNNCYKLADFGMSRDHMPEYSNYTNFVTTLPYRDPQLLFGTKAYGPEIDVWSFACIFGELLFCSKLFPANVTSEGKEDPGAQLRQIFILCGTPLENHDGFWPKDVHKNLRYWRQENKIMKPRVVAEKFGPENNAIKRKSFFTREAIVLMDMLLQAAPKKRISAEEALAHPYFTKELPLPYASKNMTISGLKKRKV
ncbi:MAG: protein kinase [Nitrosomonas sp.]|nr:protein kinase [Nitrosomonas sp.]